MKKSLQIQLSLLAALFAASIAMPTKGLAQSVTVEGTATLNSIPEAGIAVEAHVVFDYNSATPDSVFTGITDVNGFYSIPFNAGFYVDSVFVSISGCPTQFFVFYPSQYEAGDTYDINCNTAPFEYFVNIGVGNASSNPLEKLFTSNHNGLAISYLWTIDGQSFSSEDVLYLFSSEGEYVVSLTVNFDDGTSVSDEHTVSVGSSTACDAYFFAASDSSGSGGDVVLINSSTGQNLSYHWDFGDGAMSNDPYPTHDYADDEQEYEICLSVSNQSCVDTMCQTLLPIDGPGIAPYSGDGMIPVYASTGLARAKSTGFTLNVIPVQSTILGLAQNKRSIEFELYPNPTQAALFIHASSLDATSRITVMDISGRMVYAARVGEISTNGTYGIDTNQFPEGIYILQVATGQGLGVQKFVKTR